MKKITLFLIMLGFFLTASAQYDFPSIVGPINVTSGGNASININDTANTAGVPASSSGSYSSFSVSADWSEGEGFPYSQEAQLTITTSAGDVFLDIATSGWNYNANDTTLIFSGELPAGYDPTTDGYLEITPNQDYAGSDANWSNIVITLFESPTCLNPSGMITSMLTTTDVDLTWSAGFSETAWNVEYNSGDDFTPGAGEEEASAAITGTPATSFTGLTENTNYFVYYQADCGTDDGLSEWVGPFTFYTGICESIPSSNDNDGILEVQLGTETFTSGGDITYEDFTDTTVDLAAAVNANLQITFGTGYPYDTNVWIDINNDLVYDNETELFFQGESLAANPTVFNASFLMPNAPLGVYNMRIGTADSGQATPNPCYNGTYGVTMDFTINITEAPSCIPPSALTATGIGANTAELSWDQVGSVSQWNIEVVTNGTEPTGTPTESDISNPYTATGLDGLSSYDYYVQANCGSELSAWTGPFTFTTLCDIVVPDYIENFEDFTFAIAPECWDEADSGDLTTGPTDLGASSWLPGDFLGSQAYRINLYGSTWSDPKSDWIISPLFDLTGGPFQVEFDFGIMEYLSTVNSGTLGSDDTVQLLITTDNGVTWVPLLTYDNTSVIPPTGTHPVVDLTTYSGQIVQFAILGSEGTTIDSDVDNDIFVDNFRVRGIPTCAEPSDLTAVNLSLTSTEIGWTETGSSESWNIQYYESDFDLGTGTIVNDLASTTYILSDLLPDTYYEFYVQAICAPGELSSYYGPFEFFTGYCVSSPGPFTDGTGVNNITIGTTEFTSLGDDIFYENQTSPVINIFQGLETTVSLEYGHAYTYNTNIWIDFNDDLVFDESELIFTGESAGGDWGDDSHIYDFSFIIPLTATAGEHRMRIVGTDFEQDPAEPCFNENYGVTLDFTVNLQELNCTLAEAEYSTVIDCDTDQFYIAVDILNLGDATSLEISNSFDENTVQATTTETYQAGPFDFGTPVRIFVTNEQDNNCVISSNTFEVLACPPSNDECAGAITAVVNEFGTCDLVTSGTILAATPSNVPDTSCTGVTNDDVWFEFTALSEVQLISIINIVGGTTNIDHAVYEGDCGTLTELYCSDEDASITPELTIGNTYFIRIFSGGSTLETSTFDLCIRPAPTNTICENAENFCSQDGALEAASIFGIPSSGSIACLTTSPNPTWNIIQIGNPGLVEITISQVDDDGNGLDVDYALWGPFASVEDSCDNLDLGCPTPGDCPGIPYAPEFYPYGNIADCSWSAASIETLTIDNALEGEVYILLVSNYGDEPGTISIEQTNAGNPGDGSLIAEISAEIVSNEVILSETDDPNVVEASVCGFDSITLETSSPFADEFIWYEDGYEMEGETSSILVVTESNNYQVKAIDNQCGSEAFSQIAIINLYTDPEPLAPQTIEICDGPEADGIETFDLDAFTASLGLDGFTLSYYLTTDDANQAMSPVTSPYNSSGETLIIRIEDSAAAENGYLGCRELSQIELIVNPRPIINQPEDLVVCDDLDGVVDGETEFDLVSLNDEVTIEDDMIISYHASLEAAEAGTGALTSPYTSSGETVFVRAENTITGCYQTTSFALEVNISPLADFDLQYEYIVCPNATVPITIGIVPSNFTDADVSVTWSLDGTPISGSGTTLSSVLLAGEYSATITFNDSGCSDTITQTVEEAESCIFPE
ncbi:GEVED domain-containing protein, partial [Winogradskyella psychrotolerans]|uniref:GEVED domain-containing protein n=1 Tax=Winogradskyella psychrotolerans TaxID=1344585 RepID=UPI001C06AD05